MEIDRESEVSMDAWVIVLIVIAVVVIAAAVYWSTSGKAKSSSSNANKLPSIAKKHTERPNERGKLSSRLGATPRKPNGRKSEPWSSSTRPRRPTPIGLIPSGETPTLDSETAHPV